MGDGRVIEILAHAKVNLALAVGPAVATGEHAGFHPICSWMHAIGLGDTVRVERLGEGDTSAYRVRWADGGGVDWAIGDDLAVRAHAALESHAGRALPISLEVAKRVPAGGGLGGGSADAAAVLLACDEVFELGLGDDGLRGVSASIGSDVGFFVDAASFAERRPPRPAIVSGFGERIERVDRRDDAIALVFPPFGCPTGTVYGVFDGAPTAGVDEPRVRALAGAPAVEFDALFNDLTDAAVRVRPELAGVLAVPGTHLSGSGSTAFAGGVNLEELRRALPGCDVKPTRLC